LEKIHLFPPKVESQYQLTHKRFLVKISPLYGKFPRFIPTIGCILTLTKLVLQISIRDNFSFTPPNAKALKGEEENLFS
jgi:hypothetical protein